MGVVLGWLGPVVDESKVLLNADYILTMTSRVATDQGFDVERTRYRLDGNGEDVWIWEDDESA